MNTTMILMVLVPLLVWRIYSRVKRLMARQQSVEWRHWAAALLFPGLLLGFAAGAIGKPLSMGALALGAAVGAGLAVWGLRMTRFEATEQGLFFTPNARLGISIAMLFVARVLYRIVQAYAIAQEGTRAAPPDMYSPITLLTFGLLAGYYACYGIGLLRWHRGQQSGAVPG